MIFASSEGIFNEKYRNQLLATLSVHIITFAHGVGLGWFTPMALKLQDTIESPLDFSVNVNEASWIGSLLSLGAVIGNISFCYLMNRIGRKGSIYCLALPHLCLWLGIYFAEQVEYLYLARICGGISGGGSTIVIPMFIAEIADPLIRGRLAALYSLSVNTGMLFGYILASNVNYYVIPCLMITLPVCYLVLTAFFPETPHYLLRHGYENKAENSFKFYRDPRTDSSGNEQKLTVDFAILREAIKSTNSQSRLTVKDFSNRRAMKTLFRGLVIVLLYQLSGSFVIINYMSIIFLKTGSRFNPDTSAIIIGVVQIVGAIVAITVIDRFGRKILFISSWSCMALGLISLGTFAFLVEDQTIDLSEWNWMPFVLTAFIIFISSISGSSTQTVILIETLPTKIRSVGTTFCLCMSSAISFAVLKVYPLLMESLGLSTTLWFCATSCTLNLFYISIFLPETKGKSIDVDETESK